MNVTGMLIACAPNRGQFSRCNLMINSATIGIPHSAGMAGLGLAWCVLAFLFTRSGPVTRVSKIHANFEYTTAQFRLSKVFPVVSVCSVSLLLDLRYWLALSNNFPELWKQKNKQLFLTDSKERAGPGRRSSSFYVYVAVWVFLGPFRPVPALTP